MSVRTPVVSAYLMQVVCLLLHIRSDTNGLCVREASLSISADVMQVVYHLLCFSSGTNGLCICDAGCLSFVAFRVSANVTQVASHVFY